MSSSSSSFVVLPSQQAASDHPAIANNAVIKHYMTPSRGVGFRNIKPFKTRMVQTANTNLSSAASSLNGNVLVAMNSTFFPDLTSISSVFDYMRIKGGRMHYKFYTSTSASGPALNCLAGACLCFDPSFTTPGTLVFTQTQSYHTPPYLLNGSSSLMPTTEKFNTLSFKMPKGTVPITSDDSPGSGWFNLGGATACDVANILFFAGALGTNGVTAFVFFLDLDVELKIRS